PVFEPPVKRLYAEAGAWFGQRGKTAPDGSSERAAEHSNVAVMTLASQVASLPAKPESASVEAPQPQPVQDAAASGGPVGSDAGKPSLLERIDGLRTQLEECRIRRDEFYLQNDEEGYRSEVHRMTDLAKEIGDLETAP